MDNYLKSELANSPILKKPITQSNSFRIPADTNGSYKGALANALANKKIGNQLTHRETSFTDCSTLGILRNV
jgi:hypothetical protein